MRTQRLRSMKSCSTTLRPMLRAIFALIATTCMALQPFRSLAADEDGVALAIVYDTSGSMKEPVRTADGKDACVQISAVPLFAPDGSWKGARGLARGLTRDLAHVLTRVLARGPPRESRCPCPRCHLPSDRRPEWPPLSPW